MEINIKDDKLDEFLKSTRVTIQYWKLEGDICNF